MTDPLELLDLYAQTFETRQGQQVLEDLANRCHATRSTHVRGDALEGAFREGQREVYLRIRRQLTLAKDKNYRRELAELIRQKKEKREGGQENAD